MSRNHRNNFKRQYVRLKRWLTLGSVGITPRLVVAFAAVAALAAAANLIVENGVSILEQQRLAELARSTHDSPQAGNFLLAADRNFSRFSGSTPNIGAGSTD